jgi:hypothetical protein
MTNKPEAAVWLEIPEDCRISGRFNSHDVVHIVFGDLKDGVEMMIERLALERFVVLANELLAEPVPVDSNGDSPQLHAPD